MSVPTVTGIDPASGPAGTLVVITGTGFTEDTRSVTFGTKSVGTNFAVVSETQLVAYVPEVYGTVHVKVTTPGGTSAETSADLFTVSDYIGPPGGGDGSPPTVTGVVPNIATSNEGGETITVYGTGFTTAIAVRFGVATESPQGTFTIVSDTELSVITPPGDGTIDIIVTNSYGESAVTEADQYTYPDIPAPTVTAIAPTGGYYGDKVVITGTGFDHAIAVYFGEEPAPFTIISDTQIDCYAPEGSGSVHVTVVGPGGRSAETSADIFTYGAGSLPHTTASPNVVENGYDGWVQGDQTVTLYASAGGYGIAATYYILDGGGLIEYSGPFVVSGAGCHLLQYWSVDVRGNVEPVNIGYVNILSASKVPTGLTAVAVGTGQILVSWDRVVSQTPVTYRLYTGPTSSPTTLVATTFQNVVTVKQSISDGGRYFAVSSVDVAGVESAKSAAVGPVTSAQITTTEITDNAITTPLLAANAVTAEKIKAGEITTAKLNVADVQAGIVTAAAINAVTITAAKITGGSISGVTVTGAKIQTATSGNRIVIGESSYINAVRFYSGSSGETNPARVLGSGVGTLVMSSADLGYDTTAIELEAPSSSEGYINMYGDVYLDGSLLALEKIQTSDFSTSTSNDGIWIQEGSGDDGADESRRWKIYYDTVNHRLFVRTSASSYAYFSPDGKAGVA